MFVLLVLALRIADWVGATTESPAFSAAGYWGEGVGLLVVGVVCAYPWWISETPGDRTGSSSKARIPSIGHPQAPERFSPNFCVESSVELPPHVTLDLARERLFTPEHVEAVILLSPIAVSFVMLADPSRSENAGTSWAQGKEERTHFAFVERVPILGCCHQSVRLDAYQQEQVDYGAGGGAGGAFELIYESVASPAGVYVRKRRRLVTVGRRVHVDEVIEGRCSPVLQCIVQKEATTAHRAHMGRYASLFPI